MGVLHRLERSSVQATITWTTWMALNVISFINVKCLVTNCIWKNKDRVRKKPHLGLINNINDFKDPLVGQKLFSLTVHKSSCMNTLRAKLLQQNCESLQDIIL